MKPEMHTAYNGGGIRDKMKLDRPRIYRIAIGAGVLIAFLVLYIDDWSRDFTSHAATIDAEEAASYLQPLGASRRSVPEVLEAARMAAGRIRNWDYIGETVDGNRTSLLFVRTNRILRFKDDITIRVEDLGNAWTLSGESRSRLGIGDLGRNPRNLRRFLEELHAVGTGAARDPLLGSEAPRSLQ